jgi:hypothetical protein
MNSMLSSPQSAEMGGSDLPELLRAAASSVRSDLQPKQANLGLLTSVLGSSIAGPKKDELVNAMMAAQQAQKADDAAGEEAAPPVDVSGTDPQAQEYVAANRERIMALIQQLQAEGKL